MERDPPTDPLHIARRYWRVLDRSWHRAADVLLSDEVQRLLGDQGPNRFDRHQHHAFAERGANEAVALVKFDSCFVDCMGYYASHTGNFGCRETSSQLVCQQCRSKTPASRSRVDREATEQQ